MLSQYTIHAFSNELCKIAEDQLGKDDLKRIRREVELWNELHASSPVVVTINDDAILHGGGYFDPDKKEIGLSQKDYQSLAHEMGHADMDKHLFGRMVQHPVGRALFPWTPVAGALGGVLLSRGKKVGLLLPVVTAGPTLLSEHLATRKGAKHLEDVGATPEEIESYKKNLKEAYGTYSAVLPEALMSGSLGYLVAAP